MGQSPELNEKVPEAVQAVSGTLRDVHEAMRNDSKANGRKRGKWTVVLVVSLIVLVVSLVALGAIAFSYFQGQQKYEELEEYVSLPVSDEPAVTFSVDWDALLAINPDTVGWILFPNTTVNYPVVRGTDNEYYLTHDFEGEAGWLANYGAIFMDFRNDPLWTDSAYFIYGHHMNDGSMFAGVADLRDQERFDECRTLYLLSPHGDFTLRTFAMIHCSADDALVQPNFASDKDMTKYVQDKINRSIVDGGDIPSADMMKKVFAFATCDNASDERYVLYAYVTDTAVEGLGGVVETSTGAEDETIIVNELTID